MRDPRKLSNQAEAEIDELRRIGVKVTDADVVLINALCWEIESPQNRQTLSRGKPVQVGDAWLWPRTIAACAWFEDVGCNISDGTAALAYCMAHGREDIETAQESDVLKWFRQLKCTKDELVSACAFILSQEDSDELPRDKDADSATLGQLVVVMHSVHGGDIAMWERYVSLPYVLDMLETANAQALAGNKDAPNPIKQKANLALAFALDNITKRDTETKANG